MGAMTWPGISGSGVRIGMTKRKIGARSGVAPGVTYRRTFVRVSNRFRTYANRRSNDIGFRLPQDIP